MGYDLFISYARKDNARGRVTELVERIKADHRAFSGGGELRCFFDLEAIKAGDPWPQRIQQGLREARVLLVFLSPRYIERRFCQMEFIEFLKHEAAHGLLDEGVTPIYFVEVPGWEDPDFERQAAEWIRDLRLRQHIDLRPWFDEGVEALREAAIQNRMEELNRQIRDRLDRIGRTLDAKGNVDRHNQRFVGRASELRRMRESVGLGKVGVLTAVHGMGGMGKTALAVEYAHTFAHEYPGGRWQVRCEGRDDLRVALMSLAGARDLEFEFSDTEKQDSDRALERVLRELKLRADSAGPPHRVLLILDNVDQPNLLEPAQVARLPRADWFHMLVTTRLGEEELFGRQMDRAFLPVDELPQEDALALIERFQPGGAFRDDAERAAAGEIVRLLGRFTLAVETAAVYLGQYAAEVSCAGYRERLNREGLEAVEGAASQTGEGVLHGEKSLRATLTPTLERLGGEERCGLEFAALLPADFVALPWLRTLAAERFPELGRDAEPGYPDPWGTAVRRLFSRRLLQPTGVTDDEGRPLLARMHRLVQELLAKASESRAGSSTESEPRIARISALAKARCEFLEAGWLDWSNRWEIEPLRALAELWIERERDQASWLANSVGIRLHALARWAESEPLMRRALAIDEAAYGPDHPTVAIRLNNLVALLQDTGRLAEAEPPMRRVVTIFEKSYGPDHSTVATALNNLAGLLQATNRLAEAEPLKRRALAIDEAAYGPDHPDVARDLNNLAGLLQATNRLAEAEPLYRRALAIDEAAYGPNHPDVAIDLNNLAQLLQATGRLAEAEPPMRRVVTIFEESYGPDHPNVATALNNLAGLLQATGRLAEAEPLYRRALAIAEAAYGPDHPDVATDLNNLAGLLQATGRLAEAEPLYRRALAIDEAAYGPDHPDVARDLNNLAALLQATDRLAEAEPPMRRALAIDEAAYGPDHPAVARDLNNLARLLQATNRLAEAEPPMRRACRIFDNSFGANHPSTRTVLKNYAILLEELGRPWPEDLPKPE
jgi:tetratricopeptide (TPR) repeat protein